MQAKYLLTDKGRLIIDAAYTNDYQQAGLINFVGDYLLPDPQNESKAILNRGRNFYLSKIDKAAAKISMEPVKNFEVGVLTNYSKIQSAAPDQFSIAFSYPNSQSVNTQINDFSTTVFVNYTPKRENFGTGVERNFGIKLHPTLSVNFVEGFSDFKYKKLNILYNHPVFLGKYGVLNPTIIAGKAFNPLPLSLLYGVSANQTYFYAPNTFALLNYYQFVADEFLQLNVEQHFNGFIFNHIPILNKAKLRDVLFFRSYIGNISAGANALNRSSIQYMTPFKPYIEYGFGIENIGFGNLRPLRIDFIWNNNIASEFSTNPFPRFGIRFGFNTTF